MHSFDRDSVRSIESMSQYKPSVNIYTVSGTSQNVTLNTKKQ